MLEDLSAHLLDIAENSVMANSTDVRIVILEKRSADRLTFSVEDNGKGMTEDFVAKVTDPFTTTRTTRRVGMGLPFLRQSDRCSRMRTCRQKGFPGAGGQTS